MKKFDEEKEIKPEHEGFDLKIYKHVYFVSYIGTPRSLAGFFGERVFGNCFLIIDFLVDNDLNLGKFEALLNKEQNLKECVVLSFKEVDAY